MGSPSRVRAMPACRSLGSAAVAAGWVGPRAMAAYPPMGTGAIFQMRSAYSAMARSLLKKPQFMVLVIEERF